MKPKTNSSKRSESSNNPGQKHAPQPTANHVHHVVEVDEARIRFGESAKALSIETPDGVDELGQELGQTYVEDVTGADDAAMEHGAEEALGDDGGPFVVTSGATEFASGTDASNPADAEREAWPTVSAPRGR